MLVVLHGCVRKGGFFFLGMEARQSALDSESREPCHDDHGGQRGTSSALHGSEWNG